jgi:hypothetical protein
MKQRDTIPTVYKSGKQQKPGLLFLALLLLLTSLACGVPGLPIGGLASPEPQVSPTPLGDTISYLVPAYTTTLSPGESVPGTQLTYIDRSADAFEVEIGGQRAIKRPGDSFFWSGVIAPSVYANYKLRLVTTLFGSLPVAGPVEVVVFYPQPVAEPAPIAVEPDLKFNNILLDYRVPLNGRLPGSTLVYEGFEEQSIGGQAARLARIGGLAGYPNLAVGDSLVWNGRLRENVWVRYNLRALSFDEQSMRLVGTGELWIND